MKKDLVSNVLQAKEQRFWLQKKLLQQYQQSLIVITLNIPGAIKNKKLYQRFFNQVVKPKWWLFLQKKQLQTKIIFTQDLNDPAGFGLIIVYQENKFDNLKILKKHFLYLEKMEKFFVLVDIDLIDPLHQTISRICLSQLPRTCFLCNIPAKICAMQKKHSIENLISFVDSLIIKTLKKY